MAAIQLAPLSDRLDEEEIRILNRLLEQAGARFTPRDEHTSHTIASRLSEEAMTEFVDRLDAHDLGADVFLPVEFDGRLTVGDYRVASTQHLADVIEELKEELDVEGDYDDEDEDDEDADEGTVIEAQLRNIWQLVSDAVAESLEKSIPLHLRV